MCVCVCVARFTPARSWVHQQLSEVVVGRQDWLASDQSQMGSVSRLVTSFLLVHTKVLLAMAKQLTSVGSRGTSTLPAMRELMLQQSLRSLRRVQLWNFQQANWWYPALTSSVWMSGRICGTAACRGNKLCAIYPTVGTATHCKHSSRYMTQYFWIDCELVTVA